MSLALAVATGAKAEQAVLVAEVTVENGHDTPAVVTHAQGAADTEGEMGIGAPANRPSRIASRAPAVRVVTEGRAVLGGLEV
jgi:hypothetical protein